MNFKFYIYIYIYNYRRRPAGEYRRPPSLRDASGRTLQKRIKENIIQKLDAERHPEAIRRLR